MAKFEVFQDEKDEWRWHLKADNGKIIADSAEGYIKKSDCEHGVSLVKQLAPSAETITIDKLAATVIRAVAQAFRDYQA